MFSALLIDLKTRDSRFFQFNFSYGSFSNRIGEFLILDIFLSIYNIIFF
jgi:hypothetical protein